MTDYVTSLADFANVIAPIAYSAFTAAAAVLVPFVLRRLGIANNADLANALEKALDAAAGEVYRTALSYEGGLSNIAVHDASVAAGITYVNNNVPHLLAELKISPDTVASMVQAKFGALLAADPTISAGSVPVFKTIDVPSAPAPNVAVPTTGAAA